MAIDTAQLSGEADVAGVAEGLLIARLGVDELEASRLLRRFAGIRQQDPRAIASAVIEGTLSLGMFAHPALSAG
jgi:AmiR/NasT family two-component response regulator